MKRILIFFLFLWVGTANSQCSINSTCGYTVTLSTRLLNLVPSTTNCTSGYNYNVRFSYTINVKGSNTCFNGNIGFQPQFICNSQNSGYFTINVPAPTVGGGSVNANYTGTLTTSTNPFRSVNDCNTATPSSIGCSSLQVTVFGPGISSSTFPCNAALLPVELASFTGSCDNNNVRLDWTTLTEKNNKLFIVQKSAEGNDWHTIDTAEGRGNASSPTSYSSITESTPEINYYRLLQIDYSDKVKISPVIYVQACGTGNSSPIYLLPNPASSEVKCSVSLLSIDVYDSFNRLVFSGSNQKSIDVSAYQAGIYYVRGLSFAGNSFLCKLVVLH